MSDNSLASLLSWMKEESRMLKWGLVVALERRKINLIILQEYIKRFGVGSYIPPIRGEVKIVEKRMELIHDFVMDVPLISFVNDHANDSKALLTMSVMGGSQLTLEKETVGWKVYKIDEITPLQGPKLYLNLLLNQTPGNVNEDGRVILDLTKSSNFLLSFGQTEHEQRMGGDFFKDLFSQLKPEERIYPLGKIERGTNALMRPESFELRTQYDGKFSVDFYNGCVLALVRMEGRKGGNFPGENYKYLIPDDAGKDYSATVLFDKTEIASTAFLREIIEKFRGEDIEYSYGQNGEVLTATIRAGVLEMPEFVNITTLTYFGTEIEIVVKVAPMDYPVTKDAPVIVELSDGKFLFSWRAIGVADVTGSTDGQPPHTIELPIDSSLLVEYEAVVEHDALFLRQTKLEVVPNDNLDRLLKGIKNPGEEFWREVLIEFIRFIAPAYGVHKIRDEIGRAFAEHLQVESAVSETVSEIIKLNFGQAIQGDEIYAPHDVGFFGRINPQQTSFLINPMQPLIKQGGTLQFATTPTVAGVQWSVENLARDSGNPGTINASGLYQAPASTQITGSFTRIRVTATAPDSGYNSSALVTVVVNELSVHPLIQICDIGTTVGLAAGHVGDDELVWSIKNYVPGVSGEVLPSTSGKGHTYHRGPTDTSQTYVLEEVEVKNTRTNETRSVHILALQKTPMLEVKIERTDVAQGLVQLTALFDTEPEPAVWRLASNGAGSIDSEGLYRADPTSTQRFVLVFAEIPFGTRKLEGHMILPLPLVEFPARLRVE